MAFFAQVSHIALPVALCVRTFSMAATTTSKQSAALPCHCAPALGEGAGGRARAMVGTPLAGRAAGLSAASSSQRYYFTMLLFSAECFLFKFQSLSRSFFSISFFIPSLLCMVMPLEQNRPWNQKTRVLETETACFFSLPPPPPHHQIFAFHI